MKRNLKNFLTAMLFVAAMPMFAPLARAQGMPMMMPMGHHAERLAERLKLTPEQKAQWDALMQKAKAQHEAMRAAHHEMHEAVKAEFEKPAPDLAALAAKGDAMRAKGMAAHKELRDGWLRLYAGMSLEQKGEVKHALIWHMKKMHHMHKRMMRMMHHHHHHHHGDGEHGHGDHGGWDHGGNQKHGGSQSKDD
jgi:Spy/CpxP family protein refolding chaperone